MAAPRSRTTHKRPSAAEAEGKSEEAQPVEQSTEPDDGAGVESVDAAGDEASAGEHDGAAGDVGAAEVDDGPGDEGAHSVGSDGGERTYTVDALREGARAWLGCSPLAVAGALSSRPDAEWTIAEAKLAVDRFLSTEMGV